MRMRIKTLNAISPIGLSRFPSDLYEVSSDGGDPPTAILVRSADMHSMELPDSVLAVAEWHPNPGWAEIPYQSAGGRGDTQALLQWLWPRIAGSGLPPPRPPP